MYCQNANSGLAAGKREAQRRDERALLAAYPALRAEDLVNAWNFARSHAAEMDRQIHENETT
jgi:uncharacterized protein (DUF433 family)